MKRVMRLAGNVVVLTVFAGVLWLACQYGVTGGHGLDTEMDRAANVWIEKRRTGPSVEEMIRAGGDDPVDIMATDDGGTPHQGP